MNQAKVVVSTLSFRWRRNPVRRYGAMLLLLLAFCPRLFAGGDKNNHLQQLPPPAISQPAEKPLLTTNRMVLETPSYLITISEVLEEGGPSCFGPSYLGVSKKTGRRIALNGDDAHSVGAEGAPGHFLGWSFRNGKTIYFVSEDGELEVTRGKKVLVQEKGVWKQKP